MLCLALLRLGINEFRLIDGAMQSEPKLRPECQLSHAALHHIHQGKDGSIMSMLNGGAGFNEALANPIANSRLQLGETQERRDLRALRVWQGSLAQCLADRKRGRVNGD